MSQRTDSATLTRTASEDVNQHLICKIDANDEFALADAADTDFIGPALAFIESGKVGGCRDVKSKPGTWQAVINEECDINEPLYLANDGEVATSGTTIVGVAATAATADGDIVEVRAPFWTVDTDT